MTATASDRVREDCCRILRLGTNYQFFRSSANRPNLHYSVKVKPEGQDKVVEEMANFIREFHENHSGIIYTFSRKDANTVADKLNQLGITARPYHSDISDSAKDSIHRSWMRNKTQVVVATIAFGLGINKADVRFVLHHTLSKSLEAYYQESGRAGRDGGPADCVLYYSARDIPRIIGMIHGEVSEPSFWSMVRYGQQHGDDSICRRIILSILGEPGCENLNDVLAESSSSTEERDVGNYAKNVIEVIQHQPKEVTLQQVVKIWRGGKEKEVPDSVKGNLPGKDLNKDECERLIGALLLNDVLYPNAVFTPYNTVVYMGLKENAAKLLSSPNPKVKVKFPLRSEYASSSKRRASSRGGGAKRPKSDEDGWITTKKTPTKSTQKTKKKKEKSSATKPKSRKNKSSKAKKQATRPEVIDISDDSGSSSDDEPLLVRKRSTRLSETSATKKKRSCNDSLLDTDSENEF